MEVDMEVEKEMKIAKEMKISKRVKIAKGVEIVKTQGKIDLRNESGRPMKVKVVGEVSEK